MEEEGSMGCRRQGVDGPGVGVARFALHMGLASGFAAASGRAGPCSERPCQKGLRQQ